MRLLIALSVVGALLAPALAASAAASTSTERGSRHWDAGAYIVTLKDGASVDEVAEQRVTSRGGTVSQRYHAALNGFAADMSEAEVNDLANDERVASVMPDFEVHASSQTTPTGIARIQATSSPLAQIDGVDQRVDVAVAVIDTGSGPHPDLNVVGGYDCTGTGSYNDNNGHGTHVAGTIGAIDNGSGVVGVAPGARIWSIKVLNAAGNGTGSQILCGIDWVKQHASTVKIANMSLGGATTLTDDHNCGNTNGDSVHQAICAAVNAGVTFAVAAGNDGKDAAGFFPSQYDEVITVSALDDSDGKPGGLGSSNNFGADDTLASFSNFGADVDVIAPGVGIYSTYLNNAYGSMSGTSMATPHVAGAAALYKAGHPTATPAQIRSALIATGSNASWSGDKDSSKEPLLNVATFAAGSPGGGGATHDASVNTVSTAATVTRGSTATVTASIGNNGSATETVSVAFKETPGGATQTKSLSVAAGASGNVSFSWATSSSTALGAHTFTVTATVASDSNTANNSKTATTNVQAGSSGATHDASVTGVTATASVKQGAAVTVTATVRNNGSATETISVNYKETPGNATQTKSVSVMAGASSNVTFSWMTGSSTALGTHTFTVKATVTGDTNAANNTGTATTSVQAGASGATHDAGVSNVTVASSVKRGTAATVGATVTNNGSVTDTVTVTYKETPGSATQSKSISVAAGASTSVSFNWMTGTSTALGTHTFTVTVKVTGDNNAANNTGTATTTVVTTSGSTGAAMSVSNMTLTAAKRTGSYTLTNRVYVKSGSAAVASAKVSVTFTYPNGTTASMTATTNSSGYATFTRSVTAKGVYKVEVTNVTKTGLSYDAGGNVVTSKSLTVS
jgi:hypothetical protein